MVDFYSYFLGAWHFFLLGIILFSIAIYWWKRKIKRGIDQNIYEIVIPIATELKVCYITNIQKVDPKYETIADYLFILVHPRWRTSEKKEYVVREYMTNHGAESAAWMGHFGVVRIIDGQRVKLDLDDFFSLWRLQKTQPLTIRRLLTHQIAAVRDIAKMKLNERY